VFIEKRNISVGSIVLYVVVSYEHENKYMFIQFLQSHSTSCITNKIACWVWLKKLNKHALVINTPTGMFCINNMKTICCNFYHKEGMF
jgi:hypothetical protein